MAETINYDELNRQLVQYKVGITAAELHGFIVGILAEVTMMRVGVL